LYKGLVFDAFNRANFNGIDTYLGLDGVERFPDGTTNPNFGKPLNANFGRITATRGAREIQFGLKFTF